MKSKHLKVGVGGLSALGISVQATVRSLLDSRFTSEELSE
jgi:hypothetical protein